ncbi:GNAT family N-acetyltransferase [Phenylobacterium aquaticum]|uniref:GNAT family N-acetyltransferase n=1 Tax=Phenylobacterium aquaticum TaxID=1763816 RepID=UPI0026F19908|nr:GNAT family N-acetyltransferase [Phenylobacterium aquaticum]
MSQTLIRRAGPEDAPLLGVVGPAAYAEAYAFLWDQPAAYAAHLATFSAAAFAAALAQPRTRVWIAHADGAGVGFLLMNLDTPDPIAARPGGAELARIYLLGPARGRGLGERLLQAALEEAKAEGAAYAWLDAMAAADWAHGAYGRWGFRETGKIRFENGTKPELSDMVVMTRELG